MLEYIEKQALLEKAKQTSSYFVIKGLVYGLGTTEVKPVIHSRWIPLGLPGWWQCAHCHTGHKIDPEIDHYCSRCGATMDE